MYFFELGCERVKTETHQLVQPGNAQDETTEKSFSGPDCYMIVNINLYIFMTSLLVAEEKSGQSVHLKFYVLRKKKQKIWIITTYWTHFMSCLVHRHIM